ncbi:hypothetical protein [Hymenobacter terrestris]|uniref:DUF4251 domain-containing protein n=1 Tax=Hymenobacter terrestris TaxID=2748310 RepID=A0ABX2Q075_9BACT|nr:hypothetical protein [Hymenobacter terrestris]NVO84340.1 hypothetical protein [Hymenobacter terrestris]
MKFCLALLIFILLARISYGQNDFANLATSADSTFGYNAHNPLLLKKGDPNSSIYNSHIFLKGLKTSDNQSLEILLRKTVNNPIYKKTAVRINSRQTGLPISGKLGLLDKYYFITSTTKDTLVIYVDIYNKGPLFIPAGLKYKKQ